jgi:hypothetical protein
MSVETRGTGILRVIGNYADGTGATRTQKGKLFERRSKQADRRF